MNLSTNQPSSTKAQDKLELVYLLSPSTMALRDEIRERIGNDPVVLPYAEPNPNEVSVTRIVIAHTSEMEFLLHAIKCGACEVLIIDDAGHWREVLPVILQKARLHKPIDREVIGRIFRSLAHDINNLLAGILGNASLSARKLPEGSALREYMSQIEEASIKASKVSREILTRARELQGIASGSSSSASREKLPRQ